MQPNVHRILAEPAPKPKVRAKVCMKTGEVELKVRKGDFIEIWRIKE